MSNVNVWRAVENIRSVANVYTPFVETVVNAVQAIEAGAPEAGPAGQKKRSFRMSVLGLRSAIHIAAIETVR